MQPLFLLLLLSYWSAVSFAWTAYTENFIHENLPPKCKTFKYNARPEKITRDNKYRLWPNLVSSDDVENGELLFGTEEAMAAIWKNQHPPDCSKAKFLIARQFGQGFGAEMHVLGLSLAVALETGRVLIQSREPDPRGWRLQNDFCRSMNNTDNLECFYEPWSKCTHEDAINAIVKSNTHSSQYKNKLLFVNETWSAYEDELLFNLTFAHGPSGYWNKISESFPTKTSVLCKERWDTTLSRGGMRHMKIPEGAVDRRGNKIRDIFELEDLIRMKYRRDVKDVVSKEHGIIEVPIMQENKLEQVEHWKLKVASENGNNLQTMMGDMFIGKRLYIPSMFKTLLTCSPLVPSHYYFWWRAIAATYYIRPNKQSLDLIESFDDPMIAAAGGKCISTYVRHGDKGGEMKLVPMHFYAKTAEVMWNTPDVVPGKYEQREFSAEAMGANSASDHSNPLPTVMNTTSTAPDAYTYNDARLFYIGTETSTVLKEAISWGRRNNIAVRYSNATGSIVLKAKSDLKTDTHNIEYISYLVNIRGALLCGATICTYPSNYCRVIDELRATVGGKANRYFADVSKETCQQIEGPPCIRKNGNITLTPMVW